MPLAHCQGEGCQETWDRSAWTGAIAAGWFLSRDGSQAYCPRHLPDWVPAWRARRQAQKKRLVPARKVVANRPGQPMQADTWEGDDDWVRGTFPDLRRDRDRHEHGHPEGGLFLHSHSKGAIPHVHGPKGGYRKLEAEQEPEGDEQHDGSP